MLKKVILIATLLGGFYGCNPKQNTLTEENGKLKILSTTAQIGDLVTFIGGDRVESRVLIRGELDPHSYELVKGDGEKLERSDLIFYNGLGLEHGASLAANLRGQAKAIAVAERVAMLAPELILKRQGATDPHLWMDISLWKRTIVPIIASLSEKDPTGASYYESRGQILEKQLEGAHEALKQSLAQIPANKRFLVTSHDAFQYFARGYLSGSAAPEGLAPDGQLSSQDIKRIVDYCREHEVEVLFPESNVSRDSILKIVSSGKEMGLKIAVSPESLYGDEMGGMAYLEMMQKNGEIILRYLQ